jgi:ring-1,2-phenylacetyl-CoA epoxidase subunit PaaE
VTLILDGRESTVTISTMALLDAALRVRSELPYAYYGGVCSSAGPAGRGEVAMAHNYALEPDEIARVRLTCQSAPLTDRLVVDCDA